MSGGKGSSPKAPDYEALAREQAKMQQDLLSQQTQANRVNQYTPWGSVTWDNGREFNQQAYDTAMQAYQQQMTAPADNGWRQVDYGNDGGPVWERGGASSPGAARGNAQMPNPNDFYSGGDQWSQTVNLSPEQQALFDQYNRLQQGLFGAQDSALGRVQNTLGQEFNPNLPSIYDPNLATNNATDLLLQRINPQLDQRQNQLQAQLANQGVTMGSEAWRNAMTQFDQGRNDAYNQASLAGINLGMQQQGLTNHQQQQAFQNSAYMRQLPLQELGALMGGTQVSMPQMPGYSQAGIGQAPDLMGSANASYNAALNQYNAQQANQGGLMGGLGSIVGGGLGYFAGGGLPGIGLGAQLGSGIGGLFSDRRLKTDIKKIGSAENGLSIYSYRYTFGGPTQIGYMADEVQEKFPDAVSEREGYKVVDYSKVN